MAWKQKLLKCVKCGHKTVNFCSTCNDPCCFYHSHPINKKERQCSPCIAKYYLIDKEAEKEQEKPSDAYLEVLQLKCYECNEPCLVRCEKCGAPSCCEHRVTVSPTEFFCLECYRINKERNIDDWIAEKLQSELDKSD